MVLMRIVFCGSGYFGIPTLQWLTGRQSGHEIVGVVTQPPRRAGRGGRLRPTAVAQAAEPLNLTAIPVEDINTTQNVAAIADLAPEVMFVADFGQMIHRQARDTAAVGAFNLHGSLLPQLRGAAPVNWAIIRGFTETGVTVFRLVDRMDAGEVFCRLATDVRPDETAEQLRSRLAELGVEAVDKTLQMLADGRTHSQAQDESQATQAPRLTKADGVIDFSADAVTIRNLIHGTWPWPGAQARYVGLDGRTADVVIAGAAAVEAAPSSLPPGAVAEDLTVATGGGRLAIRQIRPAGRKLMAWRAFVNGYRAGPGARFEAVSK